MTPTKDKKNQKKETEQIDSREKARNYRNETKSTLNSHRKTDRRAKISDEKLQELLDYDFQLQEHFEYNWDSTEEREVTIANEIISLEDFVSFVDNEIGEMPSQGWQPEEVRTVLQGHNINQLEEKYGLARLKEGLEETLKLADQGEKQLQERLELESAILGTRRTDKSQKRIGQQIAEETSLNTLKQEEDALNLIKQNQPEIENRIESYEHRITSQLNYLDNALAIYGEELEDTYNDAMRDLQGQLEQLKSLGQIYRTAGEHEYDQIKSGDQLEQLHKEKAEEEIFRRIDNISQILEEVTALTTEYAEAVETVQENTKHTRTEFEPKSLGILENMRDTYDLVRRQYVDDETRQYDTIDTYISDLVDSAHEPKSSVIHNFDRKIYKELRPRDQNDLETK